MTFAVPYGIQTYRRADLPEIRLVNTFVEKVENQAADIVLLPRPALSPVATIGTGPINGVFQQQGTFGGATVAVSGQQLYNGATALGSLDNAGLVQLAQADNAVLAATGVNLWRTDGAALTSVAFPDGANVSWVAYLGGYSIAGRAGSRRIYFTLDTTTWDGLDYVSAEQSTEYTIGAAVVGDRLMVFCQRHTEIFYLTGDSDAPLQRVPGTVFDKGARTRDAIVKLDNTVFWVGNDNIAYRSSGDVPVRISDHGIEEALASAVSVSAWSFPWVGHLFYVLQLPALTYAYDVATQQFHELASYGLPRWRGRIGLLTDRGVIVGDDVTGQLWSLTDGVYAEANQPIVREFTAIIKRAGFLDAVTLDMSPAVTDVAGLIEVRFSRDQCNTWSDWRQCSVGVAGQTRKRVAFKRFGLVDQEGIVLQFRITDPISSRITNIRGNEPQGGHSRQA